MKKYKEILNRFRKDKEFEKLFEEFEECKISFKTDIPKEENEEYKKIFEYNIFKKVKKRIEKFLSNEEREQYKIKTTLNNDEYKKLFESDAIIKEDFLGNRDFYYLIKGIASEMDENNINDIKKITKKFIERNFGGLNIIIDFEKDYDEIEELASFKGQMYEDFCKKILKKNEWSSVQIFKIIYNIYCGNNSESDYILDDEDLDDYNYINNIIDNIKDVNSRYLLLEIKPSLATLIHHKISKEIKKTIYFFEGSPFVNDNSNEYQYKIINQIQEHAEKNDLLILQNLKQIYAFLYDLFNKNFIIRDGKKYARICHGNYSDQLTHVNEDFRIIIMVNKKYLNKVEPPFLNRFEKMILSFDNLITEKQKQLANLIVEELDIKKYEKNLSYKINYKLKDLLIGCRKQEILGIIYYELNENESTNKKEEKIDENEIKNKIFNKIYKLLPQDIIVNMNDDNELKRIYNTEKHYYNLESYLNTDPNYKISIIYTFLSITEVINGIDESSSYKMISEIKSEIQLSTIINTMISEKSNKKTDNKYKKYIFIHFDDSNSKKMGFLTSFVINNYNKYLELKFIFIVHVKRNFYIHQNKDKKLEKIYAIPDINKDIYQLFIDNLNGPNLKLNDINSVQNLVETGKLKVDDEFKNALTQFVNENLKELYGENEDINRENYLQNLVDYFGNDTKFMKNIIKKVKNYIIELKENSNNIIEEIYRNNYIDKNTVDFISTMIEFIKKEKIAKYINNILCSLEDNNILTTLLALNKSKDSKLDEINELLVKMKENYLNNIDIAEIKYKPKFNLCFIIPGFYNFYSELSDYINNNIKNDFIKNEKKIRIYLNGDKHDILKQYNKKEEYFLSSTTNELKNHKFVVEYIQNIPNELFLNDYITFFLIKYNFDKNDEGIENKLEYNCLSYNDNKHKLINLLLNIRFNKEKKIIQNNQDDSLKLNIIKINWLEANVNYIIKILEIYDILKNNFEGNFVKVIEEVLENEDLKYITNEKKNPGITTEVNECYYKLLASISYSIIPPYTNFKKKIDVLDWIDYIDSIKSAMKIMKSLNDDLYIFSIEIDLIDELVQIYDILQLNNKVDIDILDKICESLKKNNEIIRKSNDNLTDELIEEYKNLMRLILKCLKKNDNKFYYLLKFIYYKETKKFPNSNYRTEIFKDIIKDIEVIVNSKDILQILLFPLVNPKKDKFPKSIINILNNIDFDIAIIIENILSNENDEVHTALSETLIYHFEKNSLIYLNNALSGKEKTSFENDEEKPNMGPLKLFKDCIKYLNNYNKDSNKLEGKNNKNICKLFCIAYIKIYCYRFISLLDEINSCLDTDEKKIKIINEINNAKSLSKIISFYIWKIIYYKNKKDISTFINPEKINKYKLGEYKNYQKIEPDENPFAYNYINPKSKDKYNQFSETLEKYKKKNFENINIEEFNLYKLNIDIFYFTTSNLILSLIKQNQFSNPLYKNFFKNVCTPLFKNKEKIFEAIKIIYSPIKVKELIDELKLTSDNLNIIFHSYRYFLNGLNSYSQNNIYSVFFNRNLDFNKIKKFYYPGNDIENIPIYSLYSKIVEHFNTTPNQGCYVCLCKNGYYHNVPGGIPGQKHLGLTCKYCKKKIGAFMNEKNYIKPIKRENYYRMFRSSEDLKKMDKKFYSDYNCMTLDEFKEKYIHKEFEKEKGITKLDALFFKKDSKIVRHLQQISYRILSYILYSHILFSQIYNNTEDFDVFLPKGMSWVEVLCDCWEMIKIELNKKGIDAIDIFMNYIFSDLFSKLNEHKAISDFKEYD